MTDTERRNFLRKTAATAMTAVVPPVGGAVVATQPVGRVLAISKRNVTFTMPPLVSLAAKLAGLGSSANSDGHMFLSRDLSCYLDALKGKDYDIFRVPEHFAVKAVGDLFTPEQLLGTYSRDFLTDGCSDFGEHQLLPGDPVDLITNPSAVKIITNHSRENPIPAIENLKTFCVENGITPQSPIETLLEKLNAARLEALRARILSAAQRQPDNMAAALLEKAYYNNFKMGVPPLETVRDILDQIGIRLTDGKETDPFSELHAQILSLAEQRLVERRPPRIEIEVIPDTMRAFILRYVDYEKKLDDVLFDYLKNMGFNDEELTPENVRVYRDTVYVKKGSVIESLIEKLIESISTGARIPEGWSPTQAAATVQTAEAVGRLDDQNCTITVPAVL